MPAQCGQDNPHCGAAYKGEIAFDRLSNHLIDAVHEFEKVGVPIKNADWTEGKTMGAGCERGAITPERRPSPCPKRKPGRWRRIRPGRPAGTGSGTAARRSADIPAT